MSLIRGGSLTPSVVPDASSKTALTPSDEHFNSPTPSGQSASTVPPRLYGAGSAHVSGATVAPSGASLIVDLADAGGNPTALIGLSLGTVENLRVGGASGTYPLSFGGQTTSQLPLGATAATVQSALQGLSTIGSGNVTVAGAPGTLTATFTGTLAGASQALINVGSGSLSGTASATALTAGTSPRQDMSESGGSCVLSGAWSFSFSGGAHHQTDSTGTGVRYATWTATGLSTGLYRVFAAWGGLAGQSTSARYRFYDGTTYRGSATVDQTITSALDSLSGAQALGTIYVSSGTLKIVLADDTTGTIFAGVVSVVPFDPAGFTDLVDCGTDLGARISLTGAWTAYPDSGTWNGTDYYNDKIQSSAATYTFNGLLPGTYTVYASYAASGNRTKAASYAIYKAGTLATTAIVDQTVAPTDATFSSVNFKTLATLTVTSGQQVKVVLSGDSLGYTMADAIYLKISTASGFSENVTATTAYIALGGNVSAKVNGSSISLLPAIWHNPPGGVDDGYALTYALYPISGTVVGSNDTVVVTVPAGLMTTTAGVVGGVTDLGATNKAGGKLTPNLPTTTRTLKMGWNLPSPGTPGPYPIIIYANLMKQADGWLLGSNYTLNNHGYPTFTAASSCFCVVRGNGSNIADPRGYPSAPTGTYTLMWDSDGTGDCILQNGGNAIVTLLTSDTGHATNNKRTYSVTLTNSPLPVPYSPGLNCLVIANGAGTPATNIRIYPPGIDIANPPTFHPNFLAQSANAGIFRTMTILGSNSSSIIEYADYPDTNQRSYYSVDQNVLTYNIVSIGPYTDPTNYLVRGKLPMLVTLDRPHNIVTGRVLVTVPPNGGSLTVTQSGGLTTNISYYQHAPLYDPGSMTTSQFAIVGDVQGAVTSVSPTYTGGGTVTLWTQAIPPVDYIALLNLLPNAEAYVNVPQAASDNLVTQLFTMIGTNLAAGRRIYCEVGNEHWNTGPGFVGSFYFQGLGQQNGNGGTTRGYTIRSGHVHARAKAALTALGRGGDFRGIFGSQATVTGITTAIFATAAAQIPAIPVDAVAIAPYTGTYPNAEAALTSVTSALTVGQLVDMFERYTLENLSAKIALAHYGVIAGSSPGTELICYEGGIGTGYAGGDTLIRARQSQALSHHPRIRDILLYYFQMLQDQGHVSRFTYYAQVHPYANEGSTNVTVYGAYQGWNMAPGKGDGSDGLYDVRPDLQGVPPGPADLSKAPSVIGAAIKAWQLNNTSTPVPRRVAAKKSSHLGRSSRGTWRK